MDYLALEGCGVWQEKWRVSKKLGGGWDTITSAGIRGCSFASIKGMNNRCESGTPYHMHFCWPPNFGNFKNNNV